MTFHRKSNPVNFNYCLNDILLNRVIQIKDLGVTFDHSLTFHQHIADLAKDAYRRLGFVLRNCKDFENTQVLKTLYSSLVRSKLESSACVWNPHQVTYTRMLEKVQKVFLRSLYKKLYGYYPFMFPTKFLLGQLGYNSLEVRRMLDQLTLGFKVVRGSVDSLVLHGLLCTLSVPDKSTTLPPKRRGRPTKLFHLGTSRTVARAQSPLIRVLHHFNALLAANPECDIMCDKFNSVRVVFLTYCENLIDQWSTTH